MKSYPSIDGHIIQSLPFWAQAKFDGQNMRVKWQPKKGFCLYGSRTQLIDETHPVGAAAIRLFQKKYSEPLNDLFKKNKFEEVVCFFEFFGPSSFAGVHDLNELGHDVSLFDINVHKKGFLHPKEFYKLTNGVVDVVPLLYQGNITEDFVKSVKDSTLEGMPFEGVVCKGSPLKNGYPPYMCKIKSNAWIDKVKSLYTDPAKLKELL